MGQVRVLQRFYVYVWVLGVAGFGALRLGLGPPPSYEGGLEGGLEAPLEGGLKGRTLEGGLKGGGEGGGGGGGGGGEGSKA